MKITPAERRAAQNRWQAKRRHNQRKWLKHNCRGLSAEAVIQAAMRGECTITFNRQPAAQKGK
jgi:hypothetical protein